MEVFTFVKPFSVFFDIFHYLAVPGSLCLCFPVSLYRVTILRTPIKTLIYVYVELAHHHVPVKVFLSYLGLIPIFLNIFSLVSSTKI